LHGNDLPPDRELAAQFLLQVGRGRKMIGMRMRLEQPSDGQRLAAHVVNDRVGGTGRGAAGGGVKIQHAVDNRGLSGRWVMNDVARGVGGFIEEALDDELGAELCCADLFDRQGEVWIRH